ncbi:MAG TPA: class I SAM-dependent methyltransferase [Polyangiaceae bacterium]|nr:class I SAM-dependent methyltransferase [Polyangiaceae bacterium]
MKAKKPSRETNATLLKQAMLRRLPRRIAARGELLLAAVPSLLDHYQQMLLSIFASLGRVFNDAEKAHMRTVLETWLNKGWEASPYARILVKYETDPPPKTTLTYNVAVNVVTIADEYEHWTKTRTPPLFGAHADSKVMDLALAQGEPSSCPILDVGAGTGRNTLPLLKAGFPTDAIEIAPALAAVLRNDAEQAGLNVRVFEGDATSRELGVPENHYQLIVMAEVVASHFRNVAHLRQLLQALCAYLRPGGLLLFSAFLPLDGYKPDQLARELGEVFWCVVFSRSDIEQAAAGLPLERIEDESTLEYEREHLPKEAWPPTGWFEQWSSGGDLFDLPPQRAPLELRWLTYRKKLV